MLLQLRQYRDEAISKMHLTVAGSVARLGKMLTNWRAARLFIGVRLARG